MVMILPQSIKEEEVKKKLKKEKPKKGGIKCLANW
jgi:hypothetical protein